jgi:hypothetical protein
MEGLRGVQMDLFAFVWRGREIDLWLAEVFFGGKECDGIWGWSGL